MSIDPFPERVAPRKLCHGNGTINSTIPLAKLLRLGEYLDDNHGQAEVFLSFSRDESGLCALAGEAAADVRMLCQRCLDTVDVHLTTTFRLYIAEDEEDAVRIGQKMAEHHDNLDVVVCDDGKLELMTVVEDELIMSLPIVAAHDDLACSEKLNVLREKAEKAVSQQGNIKGLDSLEELKKALTKESREESKPDSNKEGN